MHDGENVFSPGGSFGSWDADLIANREISQGRMREVIIVALNSTANRTREYLPPEDNSGGQGFGDVYAKFLQFDVKAQMDANYRTLTNRVNTGTIGASSGGLITTYLGWATNVFGQIGPFSPAYLISPNFNNRINVEPKQPLRIYTQTGTVGNPEIPILASTWLVHDYFLKDGYVQNVDLISRIGCGDSHNEASWAKWLPDCFHFLFGIWDEPNLLAQVEHPPVITSLASSAGTNGVIVNFPMLKGRQYRLDRAHALDVPSWQGVSTSAVEHMPWAYRQLQDTSSSTNGPALLYRVITQ
jgi:hypothetical protein